jgi:hypothetical protein
MVKREGQTDKKLSETLKTNDWATRTSQKTGGEIKCYRKVSSSCSISGTGRIIVKRHENHVIYKSL